MSPWGKRMLEVALFRKGTMPFLPGIYNKKWSMEQKVYWYKLVGMSV
jgi:hypothetical protein